MKPFLKKITAAALSLCVSATALTAAVLAEGITSVYVNGAKLEFDVNPVIENDRTLVPMRAIFEALGAVVYWDEQTSTAIATKGNDTIQITIDHASLKKNGEEIALDVPARLIEGRTLVPIRAVSEGLGAGVEWDGSENRVIISMDRDYNYMTDKQKALLKEKEEDIRGTFVNSRLPYAVTVEYPEIAAEINKKSQEAIDYAISCWVDAAFDDILTIKRMDDPDFVIPQGQTLGMMTDKFLITMKEAGLDPADFFDVTFEDLEGGRVMMLVNFKTTTHQFSGKYIGVVAIGDDQTRCFIAQPSSSSEGLFFGEAYDLSKFHAIGYCGFEVSGFVSAVNEYLAQK